jgi:hypothetical protein
LGSKIKVNPAETAAKPISCTNPTNDYHRRTQNNTLLELMGNATNSRTSFQLLLHDIAKKYKAYNVNYNHFPPKILFPFMKNEFYVLCTQQVHHQNEKKQRFVMASEV